MVAKRRRSSYQSVEAGASPRQGTPLTVPSQPTEMRQVNWNAAGIDVGATAHFVAVPAERDAQPVRRFGAFTADLEALADWLQQCSIETVAMEATGVYWIPLFELLERRGLEVILVEPRRLKQVPGRKTDVLDCQWIQQLHTFGLLQASFRPEDSICVLRSYLRQRDTLIKYAGQHLQHMQKALTEMNVKLQHVLSDISGQTGLQIIDAILAGERDPRKLAKLRHPKCKHDQETIALSLQGNWREDHLFVLQQALELYRCYHEKLVALDQRIEAHVQTFAAKPAEEPLTPRKERKKRPNDLSFDTRTQLHRITGQDLTSIDGLDAHSALVLVSEIGLDMSAWPTEKHFTSWLCLCPGNNKTGGRRQSKSGKTRPSANRAAAVLRVAAFCLLRADCALGAFARRMRARLGAPKAVTATAHKLAKIVYNVLRHGKKYVDKGAEYYEQHYRAHLLKGLRRRAVELGFVLVPNPAVPK